MGRKWDRGGVRQEKCYHLYRTFVRDNCKTGSFKKRHTQPPPLPVTIPFPQQET